LSQISRNRYDVWLDAFELFDERIDDSAIHPAEVKVR
jgi:hypothetical protein